MSSYLLLNLAEKVENSCLMGYIKDIIKKYLRLKSIAFTQRFPYSPFSVLKSHFSGKNHLVHKNEKVKMRERRTFVPTVNECHNELSL